jgi:hypothetical protein
MIFKGRLELQEPPQGRTSTKDRTPFCGRKWTEAGALSEKPEVAAGSLLSYLILFLSEAAAHG